LNVVRSLDEDLGAPGTEDSLVTHETEKTPDVASRVIVIDCVPLPLRRRPATYPTAAFLDLKNSVVLFWRDVEVEPESLCPRNIISATLRTVESLLSAECFPTTTTPLQLLGPVTSG
jgi:hypothetical protein